MKKTFVILAIILFTGSIAVNTMAQDTLKAKKECAKDTTKCKKGCEKKCCSDKTKK